MFSMYFQQTSQSTASHSSGQRVPEMLVTKLAILDSNHKLSVHEHFQVCYSNFLFSTLSSFRPSSGKWSDNKVDNN